MMVPMFQTNAFDQIFNDHYSKFLRMDYNINFSEPVNDSAINEIKSLIKYKEIDPKLEYPLK